MADLGLPPERPYLVYDFWQDRLLGRFVGRVSLDVPPRSSRLLALHEDLGRPQFLSTDRHLTQGATSLRALAWQERPRTLSGETELVPGEPTRLTFFVPEGYRLGSISATGAKVTQVDTPGDGTLTVALQSSRARAAKWRLHFLATGAGRATPTGPA